MTPAAKITYFAALLIGLSLGALFGFQTAAPALEAYYAARQQIAPMVFNHFSYLQYRYADPAHAKAALQSSARFLEEMEKLKPEKEQERHLAFAYTRMASLEDAANEPDQSHILLTKARSWYAASYGRDVSESEMKALLKTADEYFQ